MPKAGSILTQTSLTFDLKQWAEELFTFFNENLFEPISDEEILNEYNEFLFKKNQISVFEINKIRQNGRIEGVDAQGFLWIDLENDGQRKFFHKEVEMLY